MSPLTVFLRTLIKSSAIFLGAGAIFLNPSLDWSASRAAVTTPVHGITGPPTAVIVPRAPTLAPMRPMCAAVGPIKLSPHFAQTRAKSARSDRQP